MKEIWVPVYVVDKGQLKDDKNQSGVGAQRTWFMELMSKENQRTWDRENTSSERKSDTYSKEKREDVLKYIRTQSPM